MCIPHMECIGGGVYNLYRWHARILPRPYQNVTSTRGRDISTIPQIYTSRPPGSGSNKFSCNQISTLQHRGSDHSSVPGPSHTIAAGSDHGTAAGSDPFPCNQVSTRQYRGSDPFADTLRNHLRGSKQKGQTLSVTGLKSSCRRTGQTRIS
jgi:hypothetical protein